MSNFSTAEICSASNATPAADAASAADAISAANAASAADPYSEAKELAESYADLRKQKEAYRSRMGTCRHYTYTLDDAYYLLTQGAHAQSERVKTSTIPDPTAQAVEKAEKLMDRLNREMDEEYQAEIVDPYLDVCEKVALFDLCMTLLNREQHHIAYQLYVQGRAKCHIVDLHGNSISRVKLDPEVDAILRKFAWVLSEYDQSKGQDKKRLIIKTQGV